MICPAPPRKDEIGREMGFSLLELLVSLTLFSLVLLLLPGAFRTGKRGWETSTQLQQSEAATAAASFLRHRIAEATPLYDRDESGRVQLAFYGGAQELRFVAPAPSGPSGGGLYRFELAESSGSNPGSKALVLRMSAFRPHSIAEAEPLPEYILLPAVSRLNLRYFGEQVAGETAVWADTWERKDRLPSLVEIDATSNGGGLEPLGPIRVELKLQPAGWQNK